MAVPDMVVFAKDGGKRINADLASKIRVCRVFTERKLSFSASTSALDIGFRAPEGHTLEAGRDDVLADRAGGTTATFAFNFRTAAIQKSNEKHFACGVPQMSSRPGDAQHRASRDPFAYAFRNSSAV